MGCEKDRKRVAVSVDGRVQGVGFRPAVYRHAAENNLGGFVANTPEGVYLEAEGPSARIKNFLDRIKHSLPQQAEIQHMSVSFIPVRNETVFRIKKSRRFERINACGKNGQVAVSPDIAVCGKCLAELFSPDDRRHLFPFINCTDCGPRFTIIKHLPYDRKNTAMYRFMMCPSCYAEYINPMERRFHAQPDCCFACGPELSLIDGKNNKVLNTGQDAAKKAAHLIDKGCILGVKGIGGYHLVCDAKCSAAVQKLRERKQRGDKPFALMAKDLYTVRQYCTVNSEEKKLLVSWRAPVVLLRKKPGCPLPEEISPRNGYLGFFLPYAPLHHILFSLGNFKAIVATSGNIADQPLVYRDKDAFEKLSGVADYLLAHNRDIYMGCDDSVVKVEKYNKTMHIMRRARGFVPEKLKTHFFFKTSVFAAGPGEKNTFSLGFKDGIMTSQHIGRLDSLDALDFYMSAYEHFKRITGFNPGIIARDLHPDYLSTRFANELAEKEGIPVMGVQHHHAHIASCMVENGIADRKVIGVALDGTGYGEKGDIRGAEVMVAGYRGYERAACLGYIPLPGGDKAVKEVWRTGAAYLYAAFGDDAFNMDIPLFKNTDKGKLSFVGEMLKSDINCPRVSSMGRLFDAVAAIAGVRNEITYDAQAAVELEMFLKRSRAAPYAFGVQHKEGRLEFDPAPLIRELVGDIIKGQGIGYISYRFHSGVSAIITEICKKIRKERNIAAAVLSGGVFQNSFLLNEVYKALSKEGFQVYTHRFLPSNDGCISAGQAVIARFSEMRHRCR